VQGQLATLQVFLKYLDRVGFVEQEVAESVDIPNLDREEVSSDERLAPEDAKPLLQFFRNSTARYGTPGHAMLELLWHTGARMGSVRGLDLEDYDPDEQYVAFTHRPATDTPLKNKHDGERLVGLPETVVDVIDTYVARERFEKRDEYGRRPLFCARQGRPSFSTIRGWTYLATQPCHYTACPHGNDRATCDYVDRNHASKCPSSRSPHRLRTGSITWQLNSGLSWEAVADRVNSDPDTLRRYYDKATDREKLEERRREHLNKLDLEEEEDDD